jgi:hypothetical protein
MGIRFVRAAKPQKFGNSSRFSDFPPEVTSYPLLPKAQVVRPAARKTAAVVDREKKTIKPGSTIIPIPYLSGIQ